MKILIKIKDEKLLFYNKKKLNPEYKNMLNTNVISNDELVFSDDYIKSNYKIVAAFLGELIKDYNLSTVVFQNMEISELIFPILGKFKQITILYFESEEILPYRLYEKIIKLGNIKYVSAQYIPQYIFEALDKYDIIPESRNEILFTSNFMELNGLTTYSSIYYKYTIYLDFPLNDKDKEDFEVFCKINRHLKIVHISSSNKDNLEEVIYLLKEYKHKNIKIIIHGDEHSPEVIAFLRKHTKEIKKKYKILIKISYSPKFISENIVSETNNDILKYISLLIIVLGIGTVGLIMYDNYKSLLTVTAIQNEIETHIIAEEPDEEFVENLEESSGKIIKNKYLASLMQINPEVVGWLTVNNTNINYAILQHSDNNYYLEYNIYNEKDPNGWLYMDYENNEDANDDNTIIYGHNRWTNGVMFGTLGKTYNKKWYTTPENQTIHFDTLYDSYDYQIFSIYIIKTTNDYIMTDLPTVEQKMEFLNRIKTRSVYDFGVELNENSHILTLSTCNDDYSRLVVHAVRIEKEPEKKEEPTPPEKIEATDQTKEKETTN